MGYSSDAAIYAALRVEAAANELTEAQYGFTAIGSGSRNTLHPNVPCARIDHAGMYAVFAAVAFYGLAPEHPAMVWVMLGAAVAAAVVFAVLFPGNLMLRMILLLAFISVRAFLLGSPTLAAISLALLLIAGGVWYLDRETTVLGRWGHALWHLLTAGAMPAMFVALA